MEANWYHRQPPEQSFYVGGRDDNSSYTYSSNARIIYLSDQQKAQLGSQSILFAGDLDYYLGDWLIILTSGLARMAGSRIRVPTHTGRSFQARRSPG